jgi:hypothetical protein
MFSLSATHWLALHKEAIANGATRCEPRGIF